MTVSFAPFAANPFDGLDVGYISKPTFVDLDGDDDLDLVVGRSDGTLLAFRNNGPGAALGFCANWIVSAALSGARHLP